MQLRSFFSLAVRRKEDCSELEFSVVIDTGVVWLDNAMPLFVDVKQGIKTASYKLCTERCTQVKSRRSAVPSSMRPGCHSSSV